MRLIKKTEKKAFSFKLVKKPRHRGFFLIAKIAVQLHGVLRV